MLRQKVNTYLSVILIGSVALGASLIIIKVSQIDPIDASAETSVLLPL